MIPKFEIPEATSGVDALGQSTPRRSPAIWVVLSDVVCCSAAWFLASWTIAFLRQEPTLLLSELRRWHEFGVNPILIHVGIAAGILFFLDGSGHYRIRMPFFLEVKQLAQGMLWGLLLEVFIYYSIAFDFSRPWLFIGWTYTFVLVLVGRIVIKQILMRAHLWDVPTLVVGDPEMVETVCSVLRQEPQLGYIVTSTLELQSDPEHAGSNAPVWADQVVERYLNDRAQHMILALTESSHASWERLLRVLNVYRIPYAVMPQIKELSVLELDIVPFYRNDLVLLAPRHRLSDPLAAATKRAVDLVFATVALVAILPLFALIAAAIKADGGPALFGHRRVGKDGKEFRCLKFRTMKPNAEALLADLLRSDPELAAEWAESHKLRDDPRVTRLGRLLRKVSFDELPQLLNVLRGDMSLVGPRPVTRGELHEHYGEHAFYYNSIRPGITGVWQVSGRNDTSYKQRVSFDGWYVRNWSLWHDLAILFQTVPTLLFQRGAY